MSRSNSFCVLLAAALLTACASNAVAPMHVVATAKAGAHLTLTLGTATPGGGFPVYGAAFAQTVHEADPGITIETRNTRGSAENVPLLEAGKLDLALVQGEAAYEALSGIGRAPANLKIVWAMYSTPGMFAVRADSPYRRIEDLKGKPVAWGARGSGFVLQAGYVLDALGLDRDRDFQAIYLERAGDGPAMLRDGRVAALWGGGIGWPGFIEAANAPGGARFIAPGDREIDRILAKHRFLKLATIPAGSYPGQVLDIPSVGSWSFVFARADLPDDVAYRVARALHQGEGAFAKRLAQARESKAVNTRDAVADPRTLHPGVLRYLRDASVAP
ncbi:MAG: TAXI family TRAP transporter solute-binding subunit [Usitatibacter sp.]